MRVRFAPSPTGFLHIGNARTAIINFFIAKKNNDKFILRIEDTDRERSTKESEKSIMDDLRWLGIEWDEGPDKDNGPGPFRQSERFDIYNNYTKKLLEENKAYYCYCSQEELEEMRKEPGTENRSFVCPGNCRNITEDDREKLESQGKKPAIRFKVPENEIITVKDNIKGNTVFNSSNIGGDFIIVRSDGTPVYNYIVIIDDVLMKITHVIRGEDHLSNTPKQILIARALGFTVPEYAHHALVLGVDRSKLSKRHGITSVDLYRKEGYLPDALVNYLAMLGWATETGDEILPFEDLVMKIELSNLAKSAAIFDFQKLKWMNGNYIRNYPVNKITDLFIPYIEDAGYSIDNIERNHLEKIITLIRGNCEILSDIVKIIGIFITEVPEPDEDADNLLQEDYSHEIIDIAYRLIRNEFNENNFSSNLINLIKENTSLKGKKIFLPVRAIMTGRVKGPDLDSAIPLIGYTKSRKRIEFYYGKYCK